MAALPILGDCWYRVHYVHHMLTNIILGPRLYWEFWGGVWMGVGGVSSVFVLRSVFWYLSATRTLTLSLTKSSIKGVSRCGGGSSAAAVCHRSSWQQSDKQEQVLACRSHKQSGRGHRWELNSYAGDDIRLHFCERRSAFSQSQRYIFTFYQAVVSKSPKLQRCTDCVTSHTKYSSFQELCTPLLEHLGIIS